MGKAKPKEAKEYSDAELERIGRIVVSVGESGYRNKIVVYRMSIVKGILSGVGTVIGATIAIAVLLFILSFLSEIPLIGDVAEKLQTTVENARQ